MIKLWLYSEVICFVISVIVITLMYLYLKYKSKVGGAK